MFGGGDEWVTQPWDGLFGYIWLGLNMGFRMIVDWESGGGGGTEWWG